MQHWFKYANPSAELYNAIYQGGSHASSWALKFSYPVFLLAIEESVKLSPLFHL